MPAPLTIDCSAPGDHLAWEAYVLRHPAGLAYQLPAFSFAVKSAYGLAPLCFMARRGGRVCGIFPLVRFAVPGRTPRLISLPYCDASGILADSQEVEERLLAHALGYARRAGVRTVCVRSGAPFAGIPSGQTLHPTKVRMLLSLATSPKALFSGFKAKVRNQVRKPIKEGLTFTLGGRELAEAFFKVFAENMRDLGSPVHSFAFIRQMILHFGNRAQIGIVRLPGGRPAAAGVLLCHPGTVSVPWASSVKRYNVQNPNILLYWKFLEFAAAGGHTAFDFGRSTVGEGSYRFKKQWGAASSPLHWGYFRERLTACPEPGGAPGRLRTMAARGIQSLPVPLATALGRMVRRYIPL